MAHLQLKCPPFQPQDSFINRSSFAMEMFFGLVVHFGSTDSFPTNGGFSVANFLTCKNGDDDSQNRWFRQCRKNNVPHVYVEVARRYASVNWDCISLNVEDANHISACNNEINLEILSVFHEYCSKKSTYFFSADVGRMKGLLPSDAEQAAERVFEILTSRMMAAC